MDEKLFFLYRILFVFFGRLLRYIRSVGRPAEITHPIRRPLDSRTGMGGGLEGELMKSVVICQPSPSSTSSPPSTRTFRFDLCCFVNIKMKQYAEKSQGWGKDTCTGQTDQISTGRGRTDRWGENDYCDDVPFNGIDGYKKGHGSRVFVSIAGCMLLVGGTHKWDSICCPPADDGEPTDRQGKRKLKLLLGSISVANRFWQLRRVTLSNNWLALRFPKGIGNKFKGIKNRTLNIIF